MKRYWPTMLMALVLAGLGGYLYFVEFPSERARVQADEEEKQLLPFEEREITGLTIRTETEHIVLSPGTDHSWRITAPVQAAADSREVRALLRSLVLGKVSRVVEEHATEIATLSQQLDEARSFFESLAARAADGDQEAQLDLGGDVGHAVVDPGGADLAARL